MGENIIKRKNTNHKHSFSKTFNQNKLMKDRNLLLRKSGESR